MSKGKSLLLISIILAHLVGIYLLSHLSSLQAETKEPLVIQVSMVTLQHHEFSKMKPLEEKKPIQPVLKPVIPQPLFESKPLISAVKSIAPSPQVPVAVQASVKTVETPVAATVKQEPLPVAPPVVHKPVVLNGDLSVSCPVRTAPKYPRLSLKMEEEGSVIVRVKLDKEGNIAEASVKSSSGYNRLDEAAISAVKAWKCHPAMRDNTAVEAYALQPFEFKLEGN